MRYGEPPKERMWLTGVAVVAGRCECQARLRWRGKTAEASQHVLPPNRRSPFVQTHQTPHQQAMPTSNPAFTLAVLLNRRCKPLTSVHLNAHAFQQIGSRDAASRHNRMRYMFHWHNLRTERGDEMQGVEIMMMVSRWWPTIGRQARTNERRVIQIIRWPKMKARAC
jgi:hypothetical protein